MLARNLVLATAASALAIQPVLARGASDLRDLVGARGSSGEMGLEQRGYTYITGNLGSYDTKHSYWWNAADKQCVHVETYDGRYTAITDASNGDCNQKSESGGDVAAAIGVAAGAALLGALIGGHKKHHHDDNAHFDDRNREAAYERGYNDGLHNVAYHNYDRDNAYSDGYRSGVEQRKRNTSYHHGSGGYRQKVAFNTLTGARASGADGSLRNLGFRNVDGFKSGNTAYTIWWRRESQQCLQMTVADGRVYDIRDIGRHPECR